MGPRHVQLVENANGSHRVVTSGIPQGMNHETSPSTMYRYTVSHVDFNRRFQISIQNTGTGYDVQYPVAVCAGRHCGH